MRYFLLFLLLFVLIACNEEQQAGTLSNGNVTTEAANIVLDEDYDTQFKEANPLALYIPEDQSVMTFTNGTEAMTLTTNWLSANQVDIVRTLANTDTVYSFEILANELLVTVNEQTLSYVTSPLVTSMGDWHYVQTLTTLETPYATFDDVHVFEHTFGAITEHHYIAKQFGIVQFEVKEANKTNTYQLQAIDY